MIHAFSICLNKQSGVPGHCDLTVLLVLFCFPRLVSELSSDVLAAAMSLERGLEEAAGK